MLDAQISTTFSGEPGEPSPEAAGWWSAEDSREYMAYQLAGAVSDFVELYGRQALVGELSEIGRAAGFECSMT